MAFPLAHPAAVLPLKRFCPRWLNLPALVIGSLSPDAAYLLSVFKLDELSHSAIGILAFCLPASLLLLALLYALRRRLSGRLPNEWLQMLLPEVWRPPGPVLALVASVLLGAASHLCWDSFTHRSGWAVQRLPVLAAIVGSFDGHSVRICRLLWYGSSFLGVAAVFVAYRQARKSPETTKPLRIWTEAMIVASLVLPIELVHDLVRNAAGGLLVALLSFALVAGLLWLLQPREDGRARLPLVR